MNEAGVLLLQRRLRRRQPRRQQPEGRARHIVEPDLVAEFDRLWIAAMFAADADLQRRPRVASLGHRALHQLPYACLVERSKWVLFEDAVFQIGRQEVVDVVARDAERGLRQVVGAEAEELGL